MARRTLIAALLLTSVASAVVGFWFGVREGWVLALRADSVPRGVLATGTLKALTDNKGERVRILYESDVDQGLVNLRSLDHSPLKDMLAPVWGFPEFPMYEEYGRRLAAYRKSNPSPLPYEDVQLLPGVREAYPELYEEQVRGGREAARALAEAIDHYAKKP